MSATSKTTHYELPIYQANDITSWLTDFNGAMNKVDAQMYLNATGVTEAKTSAAGASEQANTVAQGLVNTNNNVTSLENTVNGISSAITVKSVNLSTDGTAMAHISGLTAFMKLYGFVYSDSGTKLNFNESTTPIDNVIFICRGVNADNNDELLLYCYINQQGNLTLYSWNDNTFTLVSGVVNYKLYGTTTYITNGSINLVNTIKCE